MDSDPKSGGQDRPRRSRLALWLVIGMPAALVLGLLALDGLRRPIGSALAQAYLRSQGIEAAIAIDHLSLHGFSGRLRLGPASHPDAVADQVDVDLTISPPWAAQPFKVVANHIRLSHLQVHARVGADGKVSLGGLERLVPKAQPGATSEPAPSITVEDGQAWISTPFGEVVVHGDGDLDHGRPVHADLSLARTTLRGPGWAASLGDSALGLRTVGQTLLIQANAPLDRFEAAAAHVTGAKLALNFSGEISSKTAGLFVRGQVHGAVDGAEAALGDMQATGLASRVELKDADLAFADGRLNASGEGDLSLTAARLHKAGASVQAPSLHLALSHTTLALVQGRWSGAVDTVGMAQGEAADLAAASGTAHLSGPSLRWSGPIGLDQKGASANLKAAVTTHVSLAETDRGRAARAAGATPYGPALKNALHDVTVQAPQLNLVMASGVARLSLGAPVLLSSASGAQMRLSAPAGPLALADSRGVAGAVQLTLDGGGLPDTQLDLTHYAAQAGAFDGQFQIRSHLTVEPVVGAQLDVAGNIHVKDGAVSLAASRCATISADRVALGDNPIEQLAGQICPLPDQPLITADRQGWRARGRFAAVKAAVPSMLAGVENGEGGFDLSGQAGGPLGAVTLQQIDLSDLGKAARFEPLRAGGALNVKDGQWRGRLDVATVKGHAIGTVDLRQDMASGEGRLAISAPQLRFSKGGLQPADLSPLAGQLRAADGVVSFKGQMAWGRRGSSSSGELATNGLNLSSPVGAVSGVKTDLRLTSLAPLVTAPNQVITAEKIDAVTPVEAVRLVFDLDAGALALKTGQFDVAGGEVRLEPLRLALIPGQTARGGLVLSNVDLGKILAASSLGQKIKLDAVVDGRLPFEIAPDGFHLLQGQIIAVRPGRLSIQRDLLVGAVIPNAIQDFAYQALENLAFDKLDATVESRPGGRLGVIFHMKGRNDPQVGREAHVGVRELASGAAFQKPIPLPKGTPVDLTLDTSLNFDQLLDDYRKAVAAYAPTPIRPPRSGAVQP